ncbi:MAG: transposase [Proteobacteria bacterium]|nr:transposase [Pseudomonadota bacterium]
MTGRWKDAPYEIESMRRFAGFAGVTDALPDETTILNFRHLLEQHELTALLLEAINARSRRRGSAGFQRHDGGCHLHSHPKFGQESGAGRETLKCIKRRKECNGTVA